MRGFRHIAIVLVAALPLGCDSSGPGREIVSDSTMIDVLIELHLAHARHETHDELPVQTRDSILSRYGIDSTEYVRTIAYYSENPEKYSEIYSRVLDSMNVERLQHDGEESAEPRTDDEDAMERLRPR